MSAASSSQAGIISKNLASIYRKEIESKTTSQSQRDGKPRVVKALSNTDVQFRRDKLAERDQWLSQNSKRGPYKTKLVVMAKTKQTGTDVKDILTGQDTMQKSIDKLVQGQSDLAENVAAKLVETIQQKKLCLTTDEADWVKILNSKPVPFLNLMMQESSLNPKGKNKIDKAMELARTPHTCSP